MDADVVWDPNATKAALRQVEFIFSSVSLAVNLAMGSRSVPDSSVRTHIGLLLFD